MRAALAGAALLAGAGAFPAIAQAQRDAGRGGERSFQRTATYPVYKNAPQGVDRSAETVAEISTVSKDGQTVIYTDAAGKRVGFLDVSDPGTPRGRGSIDLSQLGNKDDQPTSVATVGDYVLVVVDTSESFTKPAGRLDVVRIADRKRVRSLPLDGQPDSIDIDADGNVAAIAIENQRDEEATPPGAGKGDLPQAPPGFVQLVDVDGEPDDWTLRTVPLTTPDGAALPQLVAAGLDTPADPEPEYVDISTDGMVAVTLQENNGVVLIDSGTGSVYGAFSTGTAKVDGVDTVDDDLLDPSGSVTAPREADGVNWIDERYLATANEGDWKGGTRGWSVFDSETGEVVWDAGNSFDRLGMSVGLYNDARSDAKGTEPESVVVSTYRGVRYAFVNSERGNFVAVYDLSDPRKPRYKQVFSTTNGPEGMLPIPARGLFVVSSEVDAADDGVRASLGIYKLRRGEPRFPTLESSPRQLVPWGALGALTALPRGKGTLVAASDAAYAAGKLYRIDTRSRPARITGSLTVTDNGKPAALDIEGIAARRDGGFWLAVEGEDGPGNQLVRVNRRGAVKQRVKLPARIARSVGKWGLEGVTITRQGTRREELYVVLQRPLLRDPKAATGAIDGDGVARIGRVRPATGKWEWFGYQLEETDTPNDWIGLSEVAALPNGRLAVIERDKLNGPDARVKRIYTVRPPSRPGKRRLRVLPKRLLTDVLPELRATNGWTQEKLEGLAVTREGRLFAVTDNDALKDATGETVFLRLGKVKGGRR